MKKLFAIVISVIMVLGSMSLFACGSSFDGNYKEATTEQTQEFIAEVKKAETPVSEIIFGAELSLKATIKNIAADKTENTVKITADAKSGVVKVDGADEFKMSAKAEISGSAKEESLNGKYEAYATDGKLYFKAAEKDVEEKMFVNLGYDEIKAMVNPDAISEMAGEYGYILEMAMQLVDSLDNVETMFNLNEGAIKFYLDAEAHKIKVSLNVTQFSLMGKEIPLTVKGDVFLTFDKDYAFTGIKVDLEGAADFTGLPILDGQNIEFDVEFTFAAYNGAVSVPSKFEGYVEGSLEDLL